MIRDGDDEEDQAAVGDDDDGGMHMGVEGRPMADEGKSKLVQEAKAMMRDGEDDDDKPPAEEPSGPGIKMGRIPRRGKKARPAEKKEEGAAYGA